MMTTPVDAIAEKVADEVATEYASRMIKLPAEFGHEWVKVTCPERAEEKGAHILYLNVQDQANIVVTVEVFT